MRCLNACSTPPMYTWLISWLSTASGCAVILQISPGMHWVKLTWQAMYQVELIYEFILIGNSLLRKKLNWLTEVLVGGCTFKKSRNRDVWKGNWWIDWKWCSYMTACFMALCFLQHHRRCGDLLNSTASIYHHSSAGLMEKNQQKFWLSWFV